MNRFDTTPRQLDRLQQIDRWISRAAFGVPLLLVMLASFIAGRLT